MNRLKAHIEHKLWQEEADSSHYTNRERKALGLRPMEEIRRERARHILGPNRVPREIARTVFTYWRNRPRPTDFIDLTHHAKGCICPGPAVECDYCNPEIWRERGVAE